MNRIFAGPLPVFAAVIIGCCGTALIAHETDQYSVPVGREFADLRFWLSADIYDRLASAVEKTNEKISRTLRDGQPTPATQKAQSHESLAWAVLLEFPPVIHYTETLEGQLRSSKLRQQFPGLLTCYLPSSWIYHHPMLLLDPTKLPRLSRSSTLMVNGSYFGTDKIVHFVHMGYLYFKTYQQTLARGGSREEAIKAAVDSGAGSGILSENNILGFLSTGVISNGDKAADYVGMKFYLNLLDPVMLKGTTHPPMLVRKGEFYEFNGHVRRDSDFFSVFISDHWNEVLNPNTYAPGQASWVRESVRQRCADVIDWYRDETGNRYTKADFRRVAEELSTYYGEDYGFEGDLDEMVGVLTACFDHAGNEPGKTNHRPASSLQRDSLGRTALWRAARAGRANEVEALARTAEIDVADLDGETPLHAAVRGGSVPATRTLLRSGASLNAANRNGITPLHLAVQNDFLEIVEVLLGTGATIDVRDQFGCSPLHDAARRGSPAMVALLIKYGADARVTDQFGTSPLHRAARAGRADIIPLLLSAGADPLRANAFGKTPVDEAHAGGSRLARELLSEATSTKAPLVSYPSRP